MKHSPREITILLLCAVALGACTSNYEWESYQIVAERVTTDESLVRGSTVSVVSLQSNTDIRNLECPKTIMSDEGEGPLSHVLQGSLTQFSDAIVTQITDELRKRKITVSGTANKSLRIIVTHACFDFKFWTVRGQLDFEVKAGNGDRLKQKIRHGSGSPFPISWQGRVGRVLDGAVALAVIAILNDRKIVEYMTRAP